MLVTRPAEDAAATAARLEALGCEALSLPLTAISPLKPQEMPDPADLDALALTSANALRHADRAFLQPFRHLPLFAVGAHTAEAARAAGFADLRDGGGDAKALARLVLAQGFETRLAGGEQHPRSVRSASTSPPHGSGRSSLEEPSPWLLVGSSSPPSSGVGATNGDRHGGVDRRRAGVDAERTEWGSTSTDVNLDSRPRVLARNAVGRVLYLCGRERRPDFERALAEGGVAVTAAETYDTVALAPSAEAVSAALAGRAADAVLLHSVLAAQVFASLAARPETGRLLAKAVPFALSARIATVLASKGRAVVPAAPNEAALLALLAGWKAAGAASFQPGPV